MSDSRDRWRLITEAIVKIAAMAGAVYLVTHGHPVMVAWFLVLAFFV